MPELLAPAGNMNCLKAAINAGCDAVYLSGINFGARSFASNFTNEELIKAIELCHLYGVKIYVTVNTLVYDVEVDRFIKYIDFLHKNNVDAVIMQDIGMIDLVRKTYPNLEIHASTQLNIHNIEGVKLCEKLGIKRVVLARETSIDLVNEIKKNTQIELEIFVHGALCMSYSGQCLMSYLVGGRSGNRGTCAQTCRQPYDLIENGKCLNFDKYLLSTKDLNTLEFIDELIKSNVDSLKIEGRMKSPEYVYLVTSLYRKAIDNYKKYGNTLISEEDIIKLKKVFNRHFTKGFLFNENNLEFTNEYRPNHLGVTIGKVKECKNNFVKIILNDDLNINDGIRIIDNNDFGTIVTNMYINNKKVNSASKGDIIQLKLDTKVNIGCEVVKTKDVKLINEINKLINIDKKIKIIGKFIFKKGEKIHAYVSDFKNEINIDSDFFVEKSINSPMDKIKLKNQLCKLGNTIYTFEQLDIICDDDIFVPINKINELRRNIIVKLNDKRLYNIKYIKDEYKIDVVDYKTEKNTNILVHNINQYQNNKNKYNTIYIDDENEYNEINDDSCILKLNRINEYLKNYNCLLLVGELGSVYKYKNIHTDFSLNVLNSYSVAFLHSIGVKKITLSHELNYKQIKYLIENYEKRYKKHPNLEVIIECNCEAMVCKYNLLKKYNIGEAYLKDKFNNKYKIKIKNDIMYIYDFKRRYMKENYFEIGINNVRINI